MKTGRYEPHSSSTKVEVRVKSEELTDWLADDGFTFPCPSLFLNRSLSP